MDIQDEIGNCSSCKHLDTWSENLAPHGSGEMWMKDFSECSNPLFEDDYFVVVEDDDILCPKYCSDFRFCDEHELYVIEECSKCVEEALTFE